MTANIFRFLFYYTTNAQKAELVKVVFYNDLTVDPVIKSLRSLNFRFALISVNSILLLSPTVMCRNSSVRLKLIGWP